MFVKTKTCWALSGESCSVSMVAVLAVVFLSGECCWGPVKNRTLGSVMANPVGSLVVNAVGRMSTVQKAAVVCCRAGHLGTMFILTVCLTLTFFVPISRCLSSAGIPRDLGGVKLKWIPSCSVLKA